jgi:MarR family transcriptional regulator, lower aerobic nicotinate degradation pathway regulator
MSSTIGGMETVRSEPPGAALSLTDAVVQLSFAVQFIIGRVAAGRDLSVIQARLLGILRDREPTMAELARLLVLDKSSVTGLVDRAARRGLVRRSADAADGRSVRVAVTRAGLELIDACAAEIEQEITALVRDLSGPERHQLAELAGKIVPPA